MTLSEELTDAVKQEAALRRVAVLVVRSVSSQVFDAVSAEAGAALDAESAGIFRFDEDNGVASATHSMGDNNSGALARREPATFGSSWCSRGKWLITWFSSAIVEARSFTGPISWSARCAAKEVTDDRTP